MNPAWYRRASQCALCRYKGKIGMVPASMLALTESQLNVPGEYKFAMTVVRSIQLQHVSCIHSSITQLLYTYMCIHAGFGTWRVWNHPTSTKKVSFDCHKWTIHFIGVASVL